MRFPVMMPVARNERGMDSVAEAGIVPETS